MSHVRTRSAKPKKIKQDVRHYETIKSWHRGCVETQAKVYGYLKECVAQHNLQEKYIVEAIGVGENKGGAHEHHAVMILKPGQRYWDAIVVDPWATQNPTVNDMTFPFSLWVLAQSVMVNNGGFRVE